MKKILLLGGSPQQVIAIDTAKRLGYETILCDHLPDNPGQYHADRFYQISTTEKEAVLKVATAEEISGILAYASDPAAPTAAYVAEKLGLPTNPYKSVETLCNKDYFRIFLRKNGFYVPYAESCTAHSQVHKGLFHLPVIVKPVDSSGSKGVTVLYQWEALDTAIDFAFSFSRQHRVIVEEFIEKKHPYLIGGDIFVWNGKIILWGLMNCHRDNHVNPLVPVGKSYPAILKEEDINRIKDVLQNLVNNLHIQFGSMNIEAIIDKRNRVFLIDIGPRSGGNMIPDLMGEIFDVDIVEMSVRAVMGEELYVHTRTGKRFYASYNLHTDQNGILETIKLSQEIQKRIIYKNIYKKAGNYVQYFSNAADVLGIIFLRFEDKDTMIDTMNNMNRYIIVKVSGEGNNMP